MQAMMEHQKSFRGIACFYCGRPNRLPTSILQREIFFTECEQNPAQQWHSKVFSHRCRICGGEAVYVLNRILDFVDNARV